MLTQDEAEVYDRQIRLWGFNSQRKIRQSKVLMLGFNGIASEVAKILVLAGIDTLTIVDNLPLQEQDITSNLFCRPSLDPNIQPEFRTYKTVDKLKVLNPLVRVSIKTVSITDLSVEDYKGYDLVILHSFLTIHQTSKINDTCRELSIKFYLALDFGLYGFVFNDLGKSYSFVSERRKPSSTSAEINTRDTINLDDDIVEIGGDVEKIAKQEETSDSIIVPQPSKRPRLHPTEDDDSHLRMETSTNEQTKNLNLQVMDHELKENEEVTTLSYVPFIDMISLKHDLINDRTCPLVVIVIALYKLHSSKLSLSTNNTTIDLEQFDKEEIEAIIKEMVPQEKLRNKIFKRIDASWYEQLRGSWSPVCAVLGGVAGQDIIRVLSYRDFPLHNVFVFDGINILGNTAFVKSFVQKPTRD